MQVATTRADRRRRTDLGPRPLPRMDGQVLVAPAASWTIGDQDALDTYLDSTTGPVDLVLGSTDAVTTAPRSGRLRVHVLPRLIAGRPRDRREPRAAYSGLLEGAAHCTVLVPDATSTADAAAETADLADLARTAAVRGIDTRVLGFAWCPVPDQRTVRAVRSAVRAGGALHVTDDLDRIRAMNDGVSGLRGAVDLRFCGTGADGAAAEALQLHGRPFALVDVAATGVRGCDATADVIGVVAHLLRRGLQVVLLPQDIRPGGGDRALCDRAAAVFGRASVHVLDGPLLPTELRGVAAEAQLVVTGRRALAIVALTCCTPVVGVSGDRGVTEVLRLCGTRDGCVQPRRGFVSAVRRLVDRIVDDRPAATATIAALLPDLVALAAGSLEGLPLRSRPRDLGGRLSA